MNNEKFIMKKMKIIVPLKRSTMPLVEKLKHGGIHKKSKSGERMKSKLDLKRYNFD